MAYVKKTPSGTCQLCIRNRLLPKTLWVTFDSKAEAESYGQQLEALLKQDIIPSTLLERPMPKQEIWTVTRCLVEYQRHSALALSEVKLLDTIQPQLATVATGYLNYDWAESWICSMKRDANLSPSTIRHRQGALVDCRGVGGDACGQAIDQVCNALSVQFTDGAGVVVDIHRYGSTFLKFLGWDKPDLTLLGVARGGQTFGYNMEYNGQCSPKGEIVRCRAESFNTTTVTHEVGHHFGIWHGGQHNPDIGSVMFRYDLPNRGTKLNWNDVQQLLKISKPE